MGVAEVNRSAIGLLGGSFDPIHNGHVQLARDALTELDLARIHILPAAQPWQKSRIEAPPEHRAQMVQLAIATVPGLALDMHEIERGGATYTIDTVRALRRHTPEVPIVLIMGSDQWSRFDTWHEWNEIADTAHIAVALRAGVDSSISLALQALLESRRGNVADLQTQPGGKVLQFGMTPIDASSTEVRQLLSEPQTAQNRLRLSAMVPAAVLDYIDSHHLYRD
ncbi:MAG: nicotinate (nicotinamide) nucleotide adenylyltransferase [Pseudomonadota bacterium]|nr:nicotinate (nicotinamide) nucleotide adenylyltransferase [Pseudomonadota bacterium]